MVEAPIEKDGSSIPPQPIEVINKKLYIYVAFLHRLIEGLEGTF
jgi:hypothetical protein